MEKNREAVISDNHRKDIMKDRHIEFLKKIRLPKEEIQTKRDGRGKFAVNDYNMPEQKQQSLDDIQRELEAKFQELFGESNWEED